MVSKWSGWMEKHWSKDTFIRYECARAVNLGLKVRKASFLAERLVAHPNYEYVMGKLCRAYEIADGKPVGYPNHWLRRAIGVKPVLKDISDPLVLGFVKDNHAFFSWGWEKADTGFSSRYNQLMFSSKKPSKRLAKKIWKIEFPITIDIDYSKSGIERVGYTCGNGGGNLGWMEGGKWISIPLSRYEISPERLAEEIALREWPKKLGKKEIIAKMAQENSRMPKGLIRLIARKLQ